MTAPTVGARVREAREGEGLTRRELAELLGVKVARVEACDLDRWGRDPEAAQTSAIVLMVRALGHPPHFYRDPKDGGTAYLAGAPGASPVRRDPPPSNAPIFWCRTRGRS